MSYEASTGRDIMADAAVGGVAGAGFGGLLSGGLTASIIDALASSDDRLVRGLFGSPHMRLGSIAAVGVLGALAGGAAGFTLGGGSRWMIGRSRPVEKRGMKQLASIPGFPTQFRTAASVAPSAAAPKMKLPSTMAREHNAGMVTKKIAEDTMQRYVKVAMPSEKKMREGAESAARSVGYRKKDYPKPDLTGGQRAWAGVSAAIGAGVGAAYLGHGVQAAKAGKRLAPAIQIPIGALLGIGAHRNARKAITGRSGFQKKADGPTQETGTVGNSMTPGLFSTTAQALLDRSPDSIENVMADSDAYQSLPKTASRYVRKRRAP